MVGWTSHVSKLMKVNYVNSLLQSSLQIEQLRSKYRMTIEEIVVECSTRADKTEPTNLLWIRYD